MRWLEKELLRWLHVYIILVLEGNHHTKMIQHKFIEPGHTRME